MEFLSQKSMILWECLGHLDLVVVELVFFSAVGLVFLVANLWGS